MLPLRRNQNWLPSVFNDLFDNDWVEKTYVTAPAVNVLEHENAYSVEVAAPGMTKDDFKVNLDEDNNLVIALEKKSETSNKDDKKAQDTHYLRHEFSYSQFRQTMILPEDVDKEKISAHVENGVLSVELPKISKEALKKEVKAISVN
ncbi:MAG: Hsp20/alpha crystallin family protein [Muribaculaceae bacterium]|jgi:HSP20 family protein|nr:Hsp20/alpha crystallin family protein [Muribaculaceae bacterium]